MRCLGFYLYSLSLLSQVIWADEVPIVGGPHSPTVYLIRHAEKPPKNSLGEDPPGLSAEGITRAEALVQTFGNGSNYDINYIIAEHPNKDGSRNRPLKTVEPLAQHLGLKVHTKIRRENAEGVATAVKKYKGSGNILICWEHTHLTNISTALGVIRYGEGSKWAGKPIEYPNKRFDLIWIVPSPYTEIASVKSEQVPGLDDGKTPNPPGSSAGYSRVVSLPLCIFVSLNIVYIITREILV